MQSKIGKIWIVIFVLLTTASTALADQTNFPETEFCKASDGSQQACFDLEEMKQLVTIWQERNHLKVEKQLIEEKVTNLILQNNFYANIVQTQETSINSLTAENLRLFNLWSVENKKRHEAENDSDWLPWVFASGFALSTVTLALLN